MRNLIFLAGLILSRVFLSLVVLAAIYNPYASLTQWVYPAAGLSPADYEQGWLFKIIAVLIVGGTAVFFVNMARQALGMVGVLFLCVVLGLIALVPFYFGWVEPEAQQIAYAAWFGVLPALIGIGLSYGYVKRFLAGTLQTTQVNEHAHVNPADSGAHVSHHN